MKYIKLYPEKVCLHCGILHGFRSSNSRTEWEEGECGICGTTAQVTSPSSFGHLRGSWSFAEKPDRGCSTIKTQEKPEEVKTMAVVRAKDTHSEAKAGSYRALN